MPNELIKSEVESVEGCHLTEYEYRQIEIDRILAEAEEIKAKKRELEAEWRRSEQQIKVYAVAAILKAQRERFDLEMEMLARAAAHRDSHNYGKGLDKAMLFIFSMIFAVILRLLGL